MLFESHVTVSACDSAKFLADCTNLKLPALYIADDSGSATRTQAMTKKFHKGEPSKAIEEAKQISADITDMGYHVIRVKVERITKQVHDSLYEEYHIKFEHPLCIEFSDAVAAIGGHTSRNAYRPGFSFATFREKHLLDIALVQLKRFSPVNWMREEIIYDTNRGLDTYWPPCECPLKQWVPTN